MWGGPPPPGAPPYPYAPPYQPPPYPQQQPQYPQQGYAGYPPVHSEQQQQQPASDPQRQGLELGVPRPMPPAGGPKKKAFLVGINYHGTQSQLRGCINDAKCMEYLLTHKLGFKQENILMMTDEMSDPLRRPTRMNMWQGFRWLMMDLQPGDSLVFHYSGHGSQVRDYTGTELDGKNETLCPLDFETAGQIVDDDINKILINPLPNGVKLHAIIDACHSGTAMDLPFSASVGPNGYAHWSSEYAHPAIAQSKGTAGGFAVQFGAARDSQTAADTSALSGYVSTGAATYAFIQAIEARGLNISYGDLLMQMANTLHAATGGGRPAGGVESMIAALLGAPVNYQGQEPVLSANYAFDLSSMFSL